MRSRPRTSWRTWSSSSRTLGITLPAVKKTEAAPSAEGARGRKGHAGRDPHQHGPAPHYEAGRYSAENIGHFGLAAEAYAHFTSPIRRYPDLHRAPRIRTRTPRARSGELRAPGARDCQRRPGMLDARTAAKEAARDVVAILKCEFMRTSSARCTGRRDRRDRVRAVRPARGAAWSTGWCTSRRSRMIIPLHREAALPPGRANKADLPDRRRRSVRVDRVDPVRKRIDFSLEKE